MISRTLGLALAGAAAVAIGLLAAVVALSGTPSAVAAPGDDAVQQALRAGKPTVVEFGANNCTACREMKSILGQVAREGGSRVSVVDIDLLKTTGYVSAYKIQLMPTQVFFDAKGRETSRHMGKISADEILARLEGGAR